MNTLPQNVRLFFADLGLRISVKKVSKKILTSMRGVSAGEYLVIFVDGDEVPDSYRFERLLEYYFAGYTEASIAVPNGLDAGYGIYCLDIESFRPEGHGITGICKQCGCTEHDACTDPDTGTCYWVHEDLCSACALPEERNQAMAEMKELWKGEAV